MGAKTISLYLLSRLYDSVPKDLSLQKVCWDGWLIMVFGQNYSIVWLCPLSRNQVGVCTSHLSVRYGLHKQGSVQHNYE